MSKQSSSTARNFRGTVTRLNKKGWIQHDWFSSQGECLVQALGMVAGQQRRGRRVRSLTPKLTEPLLRDLDLLPVGTPRKQRAELYTRLLWEWNDADERTESDVMTLLTRVANTIEAQAAAVYYVPKHRAGAPSRDEEEIDNDLTPVKALALVG